ncbi:MAG: septum formation protein Maf [Nitrospinae bacterium]|nr:septum formation protein Maf [Nitrospinota bacterium]
MPPVPAAVTPVRLILASSSPRRREILSSLGLKFEVRHADVDETPRRGEGAAEAVRRLALEKARVVADSEKSSLVVGADTLVALDGVVMGKPADPEEAARMLLALGGRTHEVLTGVAFVKADEEFVHAGVCRSEVTFKKISEATASKYVGTGEPLGKAGAYAIQGAGGDLVEDYKGSFTNIVGLPVAEILRSVVRFGIERLEWAR